MQHSAHGFLSLVGHLDPHCQLLPLPSDPSDEGYAEMDSPFSSLPPQVPHMP